MSITQQQKIEHNRTVFETNEIVSEQTEQPGISAKVYWRKAFFCIHVGCQKETYLTRKLETGRISRMIGRDDDDVYGPLCEEHYQESHAVATVEIAKLDREKSMHT